MGSSQVQITEGLKRIVSQNYFFPLFSTFRMKPGENGQIYVYFSKVFYKYSRFCAEWFVGNI